MNKPKLNPTKDKVAIEYIEYLEAQLKTPYAEAFLSLKRMVDQGTSQIKDIKFNVFDVDGETKFKQAAKFTSQLKDWYSEMEYFKSKISPEELKVITQGVTKAEGVEEFLKEHKAK